MTIRERILKVYDTIFHTEEQVRLYNSLSEVPSNVHVMPNGNIYVDETVCEEKHGKISKPL